MPTKISLGWILVLFLLAGTGAAVQAQDLGPLHYEASAFATAATGDRLPFWLPANRYGTMDRNAYNLGTRLFVERPFQGGRGVEYAAGAGVLARASEHSTATVHQLYGRVRAGPLQATAGWKRQTTGFVDSTLSLGSMMTSGNAAPLPQLRVSTSGFVAMPGTQGYLAGRAHLAHGWFPEGRVVESAYLHSKSLYLRVFPRWFPVRLYGGIVHNALWAGTHPEFGDLADGIADFWDVFFAQPSDAPNAAPGASYVLGNALGMYDVSLTADVFGGEVQAYRQFYVETGAGAQLRNVWDGLWGVGVDLPGRERLVEGVLWEHLYTKRQSSQLHNPGLRSYGPFGNDVYYSHDEYRSGWTHRGRTIGTPLLFSDGIHPGVDNTIVVAHHIGVEGTVLGTGYRLLGTWSRNYGSRRVCVQADCLEEDGAESQMHEPPLAQWSFLVELRHSLSAEYGLALNGALALDTGEMYPERIGGRIGLTWGTGRSR